MDFDFDDLISSDAANTAKAGIKFQPKGKPKPMPKPKPKTNTQPEPKSTPTPSTQFVEVAATAGEQTANDVSQITGNIRDSLQSSSGKSHQEKAESFLPLESPSDFLPDSTTTELDLISNIDASANLESIAELDPLTGEGGAIFNDNEDHRIGNLSSGSKEAEDSLFREPLNVLAQSTTSSGPRIGKFKPKPKAQSRKLEQIANNLDQDVGPVNEEPISLTEISHMNSVHEAGRSSARLTRQASKSFGIIDEGENEGIDDSNNKDDFVPENESLVDRNGSKSKSKSKKPLDENKKPVRKRKKDTEVPNESTEVPKKKFSHSTRRNKRQVNPELLKIPEEEFELHMHNLPLRDLIRLREHKEKMEKKEASLLRTDTTNESDLAQNATYYNYRTHMKITSRMKWSKQDTELFYEAIQQFGTDLSIITECFPGRTREQIRLKLKKEYRQHRLRIESALSTRAKGHSHYEIVIDWLKQARAEGDSENDYQGVEDEVQVAADNNEEGVLQKEVKDMEAEESPTKANDIEEDDTWSRYKSEI